jgi:ubiquinone/menaquinone biosynthesis C-methylase UbiE
VAGGSGFQLSGNAADNYERYSAVMLDPFIEEMLRRTSPAPGSSILDIACGTGRVARAAWAVVGGRGSVQGLDINPGMLAVAQALAREENIDITWHEASAEEMPLPDDEFDIVLCSMGIMFFPDLGKALSEMVRVTKPGGTVLCVFFAGPTERSPYMQAQAGRLDEFIEAGAVQLLEHAFRFDTDDVSDILTELSVTDIEADTVERQIVLPDLQEYLALHIGGLPYAADFQALPVDTKEHYYSRVAQDLNAYATTDGGLTVPFAVHFVSAIRT